MKTHGQDIWAYDFVPVVTLFFQTLSALVIVHVNATAHPTDVWVAQQLRGATPFGETAKHLICDNDTKYGLVFYAVATLRACGLNVIHTPYEAPRANTFCERFVGNLRREDLDHVMVLGHRQLVRVMTKYLEDVNQARPHQGLAQRTPASYRLSQLTVVPATQTTIAPLTVASAQRVGYKLVAVPVLNGLHHGYVWKT